MLNSPVARREDLLDGLHQGHDVASSWWCRLTQRKHEMRQSVSSGKQIRGGFILQIASRVTAVQSQCDSRETPEASALAKSAPVLSAVPLEGQGLGQLRERGSSFLFRFHERVDVH